MARFEAAVVEAIDSIPQPFQRHLEDIEFVLAESSKDGVLGLYEGSTALEDGWPARITVFKREHEQAVADWPGLVEEIRRTVLHEVGHHFGMDEGDLPY